MNSNLFQTILTALATVATLATTILLSFGCTQTADNLSCAATSAPTWLAPYLGTAAMLIGLVKLVVAAFTGKLAAPTVVVSNSGAPGTVSPAQVSK